MPTLRKLSAALGLAAVLALPLPARADTTRSREAPEWIAEIVYSAAGYHGANGDRMLQVIGCETGYTWNPSIMNRNGLDHGIAQFRIHPNGYSLIQTTPYGKGRSNWQTVYDPVASVWAMAYIWGEWPGTTGAAHWSCWHMLYGR